LQEDPLTIRLKTPGHNIVKVLGGSRVDAGVVARVTAKFFGPNQLKSNQMNFE